MHLHFVQSLEPLQGAGLGQAALSLHLAMRAAHGEGGGYGGRDTGGGTRSEARDEQTHGHSAESACVSRGELEFNSSGDAEKSFPETEDEWTCFKRGDTDDRSAAA